MLEARLGKLAGIQSAKVRGYDRESKFYFNLSISEGKSVLPEQIRKMLDDLKKDVQLQKALDVLKTQKVQGERGAEHARVEPGASTATQTTGR